MRGVDSCGLLQEEADLVDAGDVSGKAPDALAPVLHERRLHHPHLQLGARLLHHLPMTVHAPFSSDCPSSFAGGLAVSIHRAVSPSEGPPSATAPQENSASIIVWRAVTTAGGAAKVRI